ncbi:hypothetical protein [uncultured Alistipes sp.]|uniref:hypothetical protein n=1 Tax=uncultured Alistipes sp. TaxID=538949 RepID=UPI0025F0F1F8|nr:hypothetical protein [uncultured Alistipes sp.]
MEDFGSIIWLLVAVGALVFSSNSKARKRAREVAKRAKELQEEVTGREAWPSWDTPQPPQSAADEVTGRPTPWPVTPAAPARKPRTTASASEPRHGAATAPTVASSSNRPAYDGRQGAAATEKSHRKAAGKPQTSRQNGVGDVVQSLRAAHANGTIAPDLATEIREEFDLRRAVLYSEIMKPKCEEEGY